MIEDSIILTFDGTIITGLFVFYAFLVALAERFEKARLESYISTAIRYLAFVQLIFVISAILVLVEQSIVALILTQAKERAKKLTDMMRRNLYDFSNRTEPYLKKEEKEEKTKDTL